jgi:hypothetical protein
MMKVNMLGDSKNDVRAKNTLDEKIQLSEKNIRAVAAIFYGPYREEKFGKQNLLSHITNQGADFLSLSLPLSMIENRLNLIFLFIVDFGKDEELRIIL